MINLRSMIRLAAAAVAVAAAAAVCVPDGGACDGSGDAPSLSPAVGQVAVGDFGCDTSANCAGGGPCVMGQCYANCVSSGECPGAAEDTRWRTCANQSDSSCGVGFACVIAGLLGDYRCVLFMEPGGDCRGGSDANACDNSKGLFCVSGGPMLQCKFRREVGEACGDGLSVCNRGLECRNREDGTTNVEDGSGVCGRVAGGLGAQCSIADFNFCDERETTKFRPGRAAEMRTVCTDNACAKSDVLVLGDYCGSARNPDTECDACEGLVCSDLPDASLNEDFARCLRGDRNLTSVGRGCGLPFWSPSIAPSEVPEGDAALACVSKSKKAGDGCTLPTYFTRDYIVCEDGLECVNGFCA